MRVVFGLIGAVAMVWSMGGLASAKRPAPQLEDCHGRYDVASLLAPGDIVRPSGVVLDGDAIDLAGWCRFAGFKAKRKGRFSMRLKQRFKSCGPLPAGRVDVTVLRGCSRVTVDVMLRKGRRRLSVSSLQHVALSTFHTIEDRIFGDRGCAVSSCHGSTHAGNLDLRPGAAYASLVGVPPDNPVARAKGWLRVKPGDVPASFLSTKLHGTVAADEGGAMPLNDDPLSTKELAFVDAWIAAGASQTAEVEGLPELPPRIYQETPPLPPPANGYQLVLDGPVLQPGTEEEGCLWLPAPTPVDVPIRRVEIALNPGTHHFVIWRHSGDGAPPVGTWLSNDIACLGTGGSLGQQIAGAPHAPSFVIEQAPGFATILPGGGWYGLNAHYYNESSAPIRMKVWVNFHPYEGMPTHLVKSLPFELGASNGISVPVGTQRTVRGRFVNKGSATMRLMGLGGHMHKRGLRFSIWTSDGTKVIDDYDWAHPTFAPFDPPHALAPGDWIDFECLHDNGLTRPVHRDGGGNPAALVFGTSAEDEMCILTGQYYDD